MGRESLRLLTVFCSSQDSPAVTTNLTDRIAPVISHCSKMLFLVMVLSTASYCVPLMAADPTQDPVDFAREVLPILSDNCFVCHGPDSHEDTDLRLDAFASASADRVQCQ